MDTASLKNKIAQTQLIPVFYHSDEVVAVEIVKAAYNAGIRAFEFTNRGKEAVDVMKALIDNRNEYPDMALGIGTIMSQEDALKFIDIKVDFIVAPILDKDTAEQCKRSQISWTPGCGTVTEVVQAAKIGADLIKVFPGNVLGFDFVKAVKSVMPGVDIMPTGGVKPTKENLSEWFNAGVFCVGMGSQLFDKSNIKNKNWKAVEKDMSTAVELIKDLN
ncbi:beta/alpha barrel domain-containing protein [Mangrovivirga cuniculi]|uniref:Bifunctional 4-hydroxy-2-oxoglutarate aldolase/2-dehydro-3-deoxy-phosphogluconate aldolase n=1 Tax=Mangrovivirga cuniculi TaxID=2715131 RepID=A0A4D7J9W9_9BACT|nr:bifunctional 4-hydroxy-2-oxoglutarate aldolase/2-dehydro-3-deoxy-phosphogluconate aldolase [Mangrovivirga cuniculi]QCK13279.1 bifunctional 4-hydroxy-2-oxoglutarate aldolase/2-dehydro-3-deoxy-phosphogluconate aldolase [Mangrovivirga cuniculi]